MTHPLTRWAVAFGAVVAWAAVAGIELSAEPLPVDQAPEAVPAAPQQIKEVADAVERFKKLDFDGALSKLKEATAKNPQLPPAEVIMAQFFAQASGGGGAVRSYLEQAVAGHPDDPEAYAILADADLRERRVTEAGLLYGKASGLIAGLENAERKKSLEPRISAGLAQVAAARRDWATAQTHLETWLKLDPTNATAMERLAVALFQQKKSVEAKDKLKQSYETALEQMKAGGETNPNLLHWGARMALFYEQAGDHEQAVKWMDYAMKAAPKSLRTWLAATQWSLETEQFDQADRQAATAMQLDPRSLDAKILRGVVALFKGQYRSAETYFENAHLDKPGNFAAKNNLALALCEQDDEEKKRRALDYASENARLRPDTQHRGYAEAWSTYGWVLYKNGRLKDADQVLSRLGRSGRVSEDTAYYIARVAAESGRKDEAIPLLERALSSKRPFSKRPEAEALLKELKQ